MSEYRHKADRMKPAKPDLEARGLSPRAMILAAGFGTRMRPLTDTAPKPLVKVAGVPLLDHVIMRLAAGGVSAVVVNVHYLADQIETHLAPATLLPAHISDERAQILDSGGGVKHALAQFGGKPFLLANSDTIWIETDCNNVARVVEAWDPQRMDILLLLAVLDRSIGFDGPGDFSMDEGGVLARRAKGEHVPYAYAGIAIFKPELFEGTPSGPFSLNRLFDTAIAAGRLHGIALDGQWMHVGTPQSVVEAEALIAASQP